MLNIRSILDEKYEVIRVLGRGGMGTVYLCENIRLGNLWAIKEVKKNNELNIDILTEPNILKKLNHPGIPRIVDIFFKEDNLYMVQDYIQGKTLKEYVEENGPMTTKDMVPIILNLCDIIDYLHSLDTPIIYRDLKPSNIMITPEGKVILIDFGISKVYKGDKSKDTIAMGSKGYAAPEQCGSGQSSIETDIYGIGMVMYFVITGKTSSSLSEPFKNESYGNNVEEDFKKIIQKAVQRDIKHRHPSVKILKEDIISAFSNSELEKTLFLRGVNIKQDIKVKKHKLRKSIVGFFVTIIFMFTILYLIYGNYAKQNSLSTIKEPTKEPVLEDTIKKDVIEEKPPITNQPVNNSDSTINSNTKKEDNNGEISGKWNKGKANGKKKK